MWRKFLYSGFETCFGPSTQGAGTKTHLKSRFSAILKKSGAMLKLGLTWTGSRYRWIYRLRVGPHNLISLNNVKYKPQLDQFEQHSQIFTTHTWFIFYIVYMQEETQ